MKLLCTIACLLALSLPQGARGQTWVQKIGGSGLGNPLTVNPLNHDILYTAAGTSRIYVSRTRGYSWANYGNIIPGSGIIKSICISPLDTLTLLAGVEMSGGFPDRISRTTDGGATWTNVWSGSFSYYGQPVEFSPSHPDTVLVMGADTLWRSIDFGATWDTVSRVSGFNTWCDANIRPDSANIILLGDNTSGIWKTTDGGVSWVQKYSTIGEIPSIAIDPFNPGVAFASKYSGGGGIVKTTNGGETWFNLTVPSANRDTWWVTCSLEHPGFVYYGTYTGDTAATGIYLSRNSGSSWQRYSHGLYPSALLNYGLLAVDSLTVVGFQGNGVYRLQFPTAAHLGAPNGGEYFQTGSVHPISWTSSYLTRVKLEYSTDNGASWLLIADSLSPGASPYSWTIPAALSAACRVRVSDGGFSGTTDMSDSTFVITSALIVIDEPQTGEVWNVDAVKEIAWTSGGVATVVVEYSTDSAATWTAITQVPAASGSLWWVVPAVPSENCFIRLTDIADTLVFGVSGRFTIEARREFSAIIRVSDNGAAEDSLEFGAAAGATDAIDPAFGESELTPAPPAGTFDVRWAVTGTNGSLADIRDTLGGANEENLFTGLVQPGPGGYPVTLVWSPESLGAGTLILRDAATQGSVYSVDMRKESTLVIGSAEASAFEIANCASVTIQIESNGGWSLVSLPVETADRRKITLFPYATSAAYAYANGYSLRDTIDYGSGYWLKTERVSLTGCALGADTIDVQSSWNIIGSLSSPVAVASLSTLPSGILTSSIYGYNSGYFVADTIMPGQGYWVKADADGLLYLAAAPELFRAQIQRPGPERPAVSLIVSDGMGGSQTLEFGPGGGSPLSEMPPPAPEGGFDARFTSSRMREEHPKEFENELLYPISVQSGSKQIFFSWRVENEENFSYILTEINDTRELSRVRLTSDGSTNFTLHKHSSFALSVRHTTGTTRVPVAYSMGEFYPNPFNPATKFAYAVPVRAKVTVVVYSVLGKAVATLVDGTVDAGAYEQTWSGAGDDGLVVSSGVYYVRMSASSGEGAGFTRVQKVLYLK